MKPEKAIMDFVENTLKYNPNVYLTRHNVACVKIGENRFLRTGKKGESDFFGTIARLLCPKCGKMTGKGVSLFVECKSARGRLSPDQERFIQRMESMGAVVCIAKPRPTPDDPTGLFKLKKELLGLEFRECKECSIESK